MKINIIYNIFIEKGILHTYGRDGKFTKVFLRQGNLEGRCAVYSLMMEYLIEMICYIESVQKHLNMLRN